MTLMLCMCLIMRLGRSFCKDISDGLLEPVAPRIARAVGPFLSVTSEDTLSLVLEALLTIVEIRECAWMTQDLATSLVSAVLDIWTKNNKGTFYIRDCHAHG